MGDLHCPRQLQRDKSENQPPYCMFHTNTIVDTMLFLSHNFSCVCMYENFCDGRDKSGNIFFQTRQQLVHSSICVIFNYHLVRFHFLFANSVLLNIFFLNHRWVLSSILAYSLTSSSFLCLLSFNLSYKQCNFPAVSSFLELCAQICSWKKLDNYHSNKKYSCFNTLSWYFLNQ